MHSTFRYSRHFTRPYLIFSIGRRARGVEQKAGWDVEVHNGVWSSVEGSTLLAACSNERVMSKQSATVYFFHGAEPELILATLSLPWEDFDKHSSALHPWPGVPGVTNRWSCVRNGAIWLILLLHKNSASSASLRILDRVTSLVYLNMFLSVTWRHAVTQLVEALRYKPESRGFDSRWCHWNFLLT
jgi:hypothetical protein